ncbi:nucleotidyl transferase AbiEii/AbiGii toxin family protein [Leisingera caerulea]|uniref:nucleotidyl transferase AbiEii/AbiGii toxin family protein n=1 Tax=Leisingera caerulea TaxID=506591 RepID=UPI00040C258F|nr:nucleotidyl transferase AbiEii/AbiGii toxin family protein [Leisingera caerulea]
MPSFNEVVDHAMRDPELSGLRPVVEKELLHYDILFALDREGLLENLTFQGGTSLRLCHRAPRFSEDLDFVGGRNFAPSQLKEIRDCVEAHISQRYLLDIRVKNPKEMREDATYFGVKTDRWQISVITNPGRPDLPQQKIKFEVANVPAYTSELRSPMRNYNMLPDGYDDILIGTETLDEILADKIVSLVACTTYKRHRDIWDLQWLSGKGAEVRPELICSKIEDYGIEDYKDLIDQRIDSIRETVASREFTNEMSRFIAPAARRNTFERPGFTGYLGEKVHGLLTDARQLIYDPRQEPEFDMG